MNETEENIPEARNKPDDHLLNGADRLINNYMPFIKNILDERSESRIFVAV
ncbi:hypothetical protein [Emticicia fontis]